MFEWYWKPATVDMTETFDMAETFDMTAVDEGTFFIPDLIGAFDFKQAVRHILSQQIFQARYGIEAQIFQAVYNAVAYTLCWRLNYEVSMTKTFDTAEAFDMSLTDEQFIISDLLDEGIMDIAGNPQIFPVEVR